MFQILQPVEWDVPVADRKSSPPGVDPQLQRGCLDGGAGKGIPRRPEACDALRASLKPRLAEERRKDP